MHKVTAWGTAQQCISPAMSPLLAFSLYEREIKFPWEFLLRLKKHFNNPHTGFTPMTTNAKGPKTTYTEKRWVLQFGTASIKQWKIHGFLLTAIEMAALYISFLGESIAIIFHWKVSVLLHSWSNCNDDLIWVIKNLGLITCLKTNKQKIVM